MSPASAIREIPSTKTLYDVEDDLLALLDSEEGVPAELEEQFRVDFAQALRVSKDKRERSAQGILQDEAGAAFARKEAQRIAEWARLREARATRKRAYVLGVIQTMDRDRKGKFSKLEAHTVTMSARACAASLDITDEALVPLEYKFVTVKMPARDWLELLGSSRDLEDFTVPDDQVYAVDRAELKAILETAIPCTNCDATGSLSGAIECEACGATGRVTRTVPGARLVTNKFSLQVK